MSSMPEPPPEGLLWLLVFDLKVLLQPLICALYFSFFSPVVLYTVSCQKVQWASPGTSEVCAEKLEEGASIYENK